MDSSQNPNQPNPYQPLPNNPSQAPNQQPTNPYNHLPFVDDNQISNQPNSFVDPAFLRGAISNPQPANQEGNNKLSQEEYYGNKSLQQKARKSFGVKVYTLLTLQLLFTAVIGYLGYNIPAFQQFFKSIPVVIVVSVGLIAITMVMACCIDLFRKYALPFFALFTVLLSILVAASICGFQSKVIMMAVAITLVLTISLTIYAWKTESDFTGCGVYLMIIGLLLLIFGIIAIFWRDPIVQLVYSCLGAFVFAIYLVYDTQLVLGTKRYSYSLDDAYLAAIQLYLDIINLFLNILRILSYFSR